MRVNGKCKKPLSTFKQILQNHARLSKLKHYKIKQSPFYLGLWVTSGFYGPPTNFNIFNIELVFSIVYSLNEANSFNNLSLIVS